jgi:hypothetical protein
MTIGELFLRIGVYGIHWLWFTTPRAGVENMTCFWTVTTAPARSTLNEISQSYNEN